jgi:hypothetical protein
VKIDRETGGQLEVDESIFDSKDPLWRSTKKNKGVVRVL